MKYPNINQSYKSFSSERAILNVNSFVCSTDKGDNYVFYYVFVSSSDAFEEDCPC